MALIIIVSVHIVVGVFIKLDKVCVFPLGSPEEVLSLNTLCLLGRSKTDSLTHVIKLGENCVNCPGGRVDYNQRSNL